MPNRLVPSAVSLIVNQKATNSVLLTVPTKGFEQQMLDSKEVVILPLLDKFSYLCLEELLVELPPMRDIKHRINLIFGSNIPNLPHYKISLREDDILQQIVDDLVKKNMIKPKFKSVCYASITCP